MPALVMQKSVSEKEKDITVSKKMFVNMSNGNFTDKYEFVGKKRIGSGAYGEVWKCMNRTTKIVMAVKIIKKGKLDEREA